MSLDDRRGIETNTGLNPVLKIALNVFCMHRTETGVSPHSNAPIIQYKDT